MDPRLACLIHEYLDSIKSIVALMNRSGIPVPYSRSSWMFAKIPSTGELDGGCVIKNMALVVECFLMEGWLISILGKMEK